MIGKKVKFKISASSGGVFIGTVIDKVNIPSTVGMGYLPMDNYVIEDSDRDIHIIDPIYLIKTMD